MRRRKTRSRRFAPKDNRVTRHNIFHTGSSLLREEDGFGNGSRHGVVVGVVVVVGDDNDNSKGSEKQKKGKATRMDFVADRCVFLVVVVDQEGLLVFRTHVI